MFAPVVGSNNARPTSRTSLIIRYGWRLLPWRRSASSNRQQFTTVPSLPTETGCNTSMFYRAVPHWDYIADGTSYWPLLTSPAAFIRIMNGGGAKPAFLLRMRHRLGGVGPIGSPGRGILVMWRSRSWRKGCLAPPLSPTQRRSSPPVPSDDRPVPAEQEPGDPPDFGTAGTSMLPVPVDQQLVSMEFEIPAGFDVHRRAGS